MLPVCDHYSGVEARMRKSLSLQSELMQEFGACVFDVTLDCEDGARVGGELEHATMVVELAREAIANSSRTGAFGARRVAVRVHPVRHPAFEMDVQTILSGAGVELCHVMIPKVESLEDVDAAVGAIDRSCPGRGEAGPMPLHVLLESPAAVHHAFAIASHPRVQSASFGLMDFVSSHGGAIPSDAMSVGGQFEHPLVVRAKLEVSAACHAHGKVPSHCVVTEFRDLDALRRSASTAARKFGYTRMWSIHPGQIRTIVDAFAPARSEIDVAAQIIGAASKADWAPIEFSGQLHDRASYRFFWQILERAHQTGRALPDEVRPYFDNPVQ